MSDKKQTSVNIIIEKFNLLSDYDFKIWFLNSIDKLEALEKEQIIDAYYIGADEESDRHGAMYQTKRMLYTTIFQPMETKKTAVEWLMENLHTAKDPFTQAKEMEKQQHFESCRCGNSFLDDDRLDFKDYFEQYYTDTYKP